MNQLVRPAARSASASGVSGGSVPSAGLTSIELRRANGSACIHTSRPLVPRELSSDQAASERLAASSRWANSASVSQKRSPNPSGRANAMRPVLIRSSV